MNVKVERISDNQVKLTIEVSKEEFGVALDKAFEKVSPTVKVDGFRPGKLPKSSFIKRFGYESLYEEAVNFAINDTYPQAIQENKVEVVNYPEVDIDFKTLSHETGFTYTAVVDVIPEVTLGEYKGLVVKPLSTRVTKKEVEEDINAKLAQKAENLVKEGPAELGDTVVIDFEGFVDGVAFEGGKSENYALELGSGSFIPGFEEQLVGTTENSEVDVNVVFPENYHAELASKAAVFKVKVHEVKQKVTPELTEEFVAEQNIEGVTTVEEYRKHTEQHIRSHKEAESERKFVNDLVELATKNASVNIPKCLIDEEAKRLKADAEAQAKQYKMPFEVLLQYMGQTLEQFEEQAAKRAETQVKVELVISKIAEVEGLQVTKEELEAEYANLAAKYNMELEAVKKAVHPQNLYLQVEQQKVINLLKETAVTKAAKKEAPAKEEAPVKKTRKPCAKKAKAE